MKILVSYEPDDLERRLKDASNLCNLQSSNKRDIQNLIAIAYAELEPETIIQLCLCEQNRLILRPGILYSFSADENCTECQKLKSETSS